jgi:hypothetical protein
MRTINSIAIARAIAAALFLFILAATAAAQNKNLAGGFQALPKNAKVVLMPTDIELFFLSAGGVRSGYEDGARRLLTFQTNSWRAT